MKIDVGGGATDVRASIVNAVFRRIAPLTLMAGDTVGLVRGALHPRRAGFGVMIESMTADAVPFQRVHGAAVYARALARAAV